MMVNWLTRAAQWIEARASQAPGGKLLGQGRSTSISGARRSTAGARTEAQAPEAPRGTRYTTVPESSPQAPGVALQGQGCSLLTLERKK
jgi:hypothetical protein